MNKQSNQQPSAIMPDESTQLAVLEGSNKLQRWFKGFFTAQNIAVIGILTAISFVLYAFVKFPLPFMFPAFLDIQISDLPALLASFALGPVAGAMVIVVKCCLKMMMTTTACVGELGDIIIGLAFVIPAGILYQYKKCKKFAVIGLTVGAVSAIGVSVLSNWLLLIPFYTKAFGMNAIIDMVASLYEGVTADTFMSYYLPLAVVPFNILRCGICAVVTYFSYKPLSKLLHWEHGSNKSKATKTQQTNTISTEDNLHNEQDSDNKQ